MIDVDLLARSFHSAPFDTPCPWWKEPFSECPMTSSHYKRAVETVDEYERLRAREATPVSEASDE